MKIAIISDAWHPQINGVVRTYEHITRNLRDMGHVTMVIGPDDFRWHTALPSYGEIKLALFSYKRMSRIINEFAPDHIHIATEGPLGWAARKYCLKHNEQYSTSYHTDFPSYLQKRMLKRAPFLAPYIYKATKAYLKKFHKPSQNMLIATQSLEDKLKSWGFNMPMKRLTRGVDLDIFKPDKCDLFENLPKPVALFVGRVSIEKNIEDFLTMPWPGSKVVVGDGPSFQTLKNKYPNTSFVGRKTGHDLANHYRASDVFVFPSKTDTFGIVIIEALACGIPVAAYNVMGPKDIITNPELGITTDRNIETAALKALNTGSPQARYNHVKQHYTWTKAAKQFAENAASINKSAQ